MKLFLYVYYVYIYPSICFSRQYFKLYSCHSMSLLCQYPFVCFKIEMGTKKMAKSYYFYFVFIPFSLLGECFLVQVCYFAPKLANILTTSIFYQFNRWFLSSLACGNSSLLWLKGILVGLVLGSWHGCEACNALRMLLKNSVACHIVARYACNIVEQSFLFLFTRLISMATCNY